MKLSSVLQIAGGIAIASGGLYIFLKDVDIKEIVNQIQQTEWWVIAIVAFLGPLSLWFRGLRWNLMLPERDSVSRKGLFSICVIAFAVNNILPARLGEAARALLLWRRNKFTIAESVGSLVLERALDSSVYLSFLFVPIFFISRLHGLFFWGYICAVIFAGFILTLAFYAAFPSFTKRVSAKILVLIPGRLHEKLQKLGIELLSNLDWVFSIKKVILICLLSYLITFCYAGMIWLLGIKLEGFRFLESIFGVAFAALGAAIPLSPGYVGTLHAVLQKGLGLLGVAGESAAAIAVLYHAIGYIVVTGMGIFLFFAMKITVDDIGKAKEQIGE